MKNPKPDPEAVCPDHVDMFIELVECNDCNIYPQATINEHIKQATLAERARCIKIVENVFHPYPPSSEIVKAITSAMTALQPNQEVL